MQEPSPAGGTDQLRTPARLDRGKGVDNDVFDPMGVATGKAAVSVPFLRCFPRSVLEHFLHPRRVVLVGA